MSADSIPDCKICKYAYYHTIYNSTYSYTNSIGYDFSYLKLLDTILVFP
jgi:hypothetical protein